MLEQQEKGDCSFSRRAERTISVLLTGSTGNLGSYLLDVLVKTSCVSQVVCLNRSPDARAAQVKNLESRGLDVAALAPDEDDDRPDVRFLQASLHEEKFALDVAMYMELVENVDLIIHSAWPVDFNRNLKSFVPSVRGVENLLDFCSAATAFGRKVRLLFISSVAAASNWASAAPTSRSYIPEVELTDWKLARTGYGQSKLLSERILARASCSDPLRQISIARVGQLCGPVLRGVQGKWPPQEWVPSMIRSAVMLKAIPDNLGPASRVDWIPVDKAAEVLVDVAMHSLPSHDDVSPERAVTTKSRRCHMDHRRHRNWRHDSSKAQFYHIVNPRDTSWAAILPAILKHLPSSVKPCTFSSFVDKLHDSIQTSGGFEGVDEGINPAAKLYDMFENLQDRAIRFPKALAPPFATTNAVQVSAALADLPAISDEWMQLFMKQWGW